MTASRNEKRIWFLQLCRAFACLLIVYIHWITYVYRPNNLTSMLHLPPLFPYPLLNGLQNYLYSVAAHTPPQFNEVFFGLGLFFLISGYVIPLSLTKGSAFEFLIRRFFRIYPTVFIGLLLAVSMIALSRTIEHLPIFYYRWDAIIANALLIRNILHLPFIEPVLWTLEIEVHFYFIFFLLAFFNKQKTASFILFIPLVLAFTSHINAVYIDLMLIGTCLYHWNEKNWTGKKAFAMVMTLFFFDYCFLTHFHSMRLTGNAIFTNHLYVLNVFFILLLLNDYLPYSRVLNKVAEISYPLYIVHSITGYTAYHLLFLWTHNIPSSFAGAFVIIFSLSFLIHHYVELPGIAFSKKIIFYVKRRSALEHGTISSPVEKTSFDSLRF